MLTQFPKHHTCSNGRRCRLWLGGRRRILECNKSHSQNRGVSKSNRHEDRRSLGRSGGRLGRNEHGDRTQTSRRRRHVHVVSGSTSTSLLPCSELDLSLTSRNCKLRWLDGNLHSHCILTYELLDWCTCCWNIEGWCRNNDSIYWISSSPKYTRD